MYYWEGFVTGVFWTIAIGCLLGGIAGHAYKSGQDSAKGDNDEA